MSFYENMSPIERALFAMKMIPFKYSMPLEEWEKWVVKMKSARTEQEFMDTIDLLPTIQ